MKILLLEYITAGGLNSEPLDTALLLEATLMRDALLRDFNDIATVQVITTYDERLAKPENVHQAISIGVNANPESVWQELLTHCDAALVVAPETGGILEKLTQMIETAQVKNLGSHFAAVSAASDKYKTHQLLTSGNIAAIPTCKATDSAKLAASNDGFIIKPNDGAGCEATYYFGDLEAVHDWLAEHVHDNLIIQPYQEGQAASISALFRQGHAWVLSCNEQIVEVESNQAVQLKGCRVNAFSQYLPIFNQLANRMATVLPQLNGYVGIDVIIHHEEIYVVEINPRITTSYIGLHESLNYNPAHLILDSVCDPAFELPSAMGKQVVDIHLNA